MWALDFVPHCLGLVVSVFAFLKASEHITTECILWDQEVQTSKNPWTSFEDSTVWEVGGGGGVMEGKAMNREGKRWRGETKAEAEWRSTDNKECNSLIFFYTQQVRLNQRY